MELRIGDYGRHIFDIMTRGEDRACGKHWKSIRAKAIPLVKQLIDLNKEMEGGGYDLIDYNINFHNAELPKEERASDYEIACRMQEKLFGVKAGDLKPGDWAWLNTEQSIPFEDGLQVKMTDVLENCVLFEHEDYHELAYVKIPKDQIVIRFPDEDDEDYDAYFIGHDYWLKKAEELNEDSIFRR